MSGDELRISEDYFRVYKLTPPSEMKQEDFVKFVHEEVFSAVNMRPTRFGVISELHLLTTHETDEFIWVIKWNGVEPGQGGHPASDIADALQKLESSGTLMSAPSNFYYEVAIVAIQWETKPGL